MYDRNRKRRRKDRINVKKKGKVKIQGNLNHTSKLKRGIKYGISVYIRDYKMYHLFCNCFLNNTIVIYPVLTA